MFWKVVLSAAVAELGAAFESLNFNDLRFFHGQRIPYKDDFDTEPIQLQGHGGEGETAIHVDCESIQLVNEGVLKVV